MINFLANTFEVATYDEPVFVTSMNESVQNQGVRTLKKLGVQETRYSFRVKKTGKGY